ncbi:MAG: DUF3413 domain-containing protein [Gammaproteobacteria bacterium]|nr:DUF3413 domain-containing protein [Gammaproteobacteria bacterium]
MNNYLSVNSRSEIFRWQGWFYFLNTFVLLIVGGRYFLLQPWPDTFLSQLFVSLSYPGHFLTMSMSVILVSGLLTLILPRLRWIKGISIALMTLVIVILGIDSVVFELYRFHLNGMVWSLIINGGIFEILPISWLSWFFVALGIGLVIYVEIKIAHFISSWLETDYEYGYKVSIAAVLIVFFGQFIHAWGDANNQVSITKQVRYLPAYKPATMKRFLRQKGFEAAASEVHIPKSDSTLQYPLNAMQCSAETEQKNILIVAIDSWRFDMMTEKATPNIYDFSKNAITYDQHFSTGNATRFGIFGMYYGMYGTYWHAVLAEERGPVLIDVLKEQGYDFSVHASARLTSPEFNRTVFSEIRNEISLRTPGITAHKRDEQITDDFVDFLRERDKAKPFFGFVFYDAPHGYTYPKTAEEPFQPVWKTINHLALDNNFDPAPYRNRFLNSVHYNDKLIKSIIDELKGQQLLDNTIVIFTGDHGEEFNETGKNYWGHNSNFTRYQTQVPMVVYWPGMKADVIKYPTGHLDVAPTLLKNALGCVNPTLDYSLGTSMFSPERKPYFLISGWDRFALVTDKQIDLVYNAGHVEHYDHDYSPLESSVTDIKTMTKAMDEMSHFYAK